MGIIENLDQKLARMERNIERLLQANPIHTEIQSRAVQETTKKPINIDEVAQLTDLAKSTIYKLTHKSEIPFSKVRGRIYFFEHEIIEWILSGKRKTIQELETEVDEALSKRKRV
jgi:excisionase family DNA binding protein